MLEETEQWCQKATLTPHQVIDSFIEWVEGATKDIHPSCYLITDNGGFDTPLLKHFSLKKDILYLFGNTYREVVDVSSVYLGLSYLPVTTDVLERSAKTLAIQGYNTLHRDVLTLPEFEVKHDHNPVNDSIAMASYWCWFQNRLVDQTFCI